MKLCSFDADNSNPFFLIAGPCVIEGESFLLDIAAELQQITTELDIPLIFKSSFDKANRSSMSSFRGPGVEDGLNALEAVKTDLGLPVLTDVHEDTPLNEGASVVDVMQTPSFLCRQTNFILAVASCGKPVNIKKGQFLSPWEMINVVDKAKSTGNENIMVCERGYMFGYNNLVADMRSLVALRQTGCPVIFDAGHSVQRPGSQGDMSGGDRRLIPPLARAAVATGIAGLFLETHPNPNEAKSDGPNSWALSNLKALLIRLKAIDIAVKEGSLEEHLD